MDSRNIVRRIRQETVRAVADTRALTGLLTRLSPGGPEPELPRALAVMPLAGTLVGAAGGVVLIAAAGIGLTPLAAAVAAVAALVWLTGALHEDGLADTADGLGGGADREAKLAIMRDSRIGTYGAAALTLALVARIALLADLAATSGALAAALALAAAGGLSRTGMVHALRALPPARDNGLGRSAGRPDGSTMAQAAGIAAAVAAILLVPSLGGLALLAALAATVVATAMAERMARRHIGGQTGDLCGALQQAAEILCLAGIAVAG